MVMIPVTKLRAGATFKDEGVPYQVIKYAHVKMGRGGATVRVTARNLNNWAVEERTFNNGASVEPVDVQKRSMQYLYSDGKNCVFMDNKSFDQIEVNKDILGERVAFLKEGESVDVVVVTWSRTFRDGLS